MRRIPVRNRAGSALFVAFGIGSIGLAIAVSQPLLVGVGAIALVAALLAVRSFPLDRNW